MTDIHADVAAEVAQLARASGRLALDTEFMGEGRYRTLLCLVQLAVPDGAETRIEVFDPLHADTDASALGSVLADPAIEVVVHAGRQDIAFLKRWLACEVHNVFDTQVAAGFAGLPAQASYDSLLGEVVGVRLAKTASYTRWDRRPLSAEQIGYAREDVVHLLELAERLQDRLRRSGRLQWALEECRPLEQASDVRDPEAIFQRLPRVRGLRPEAQATARELVIWREQTADQFDRPVASILGDAPLLELAKRRPERRRELEQIRGLHPSAVRRYGDELLAAVRRGRERREPVLEEERRGPPPDGDDAAIVALGEALVRARARAAGLAYELVAARADLQAIVTSWRTGTPAVDVRTLEGWRRELVGEELLALLDGERRLAVHERRVHAFPSEDGAAPTA
ncbi:MAG TPA: HRDC domain-containing protein [Solirubrobacteraceae bacterium]|nr:HRDC domain-containing protein [Solirubrobacteraceae bacterium]